MVVFFRSKDLAMKLSVALKEWSPVLEALGNGTQTMVVRKYAPQNQKLLLYPTFSFFTTLKRKPGVFEV